MPDYDGTSRAIEMYFAANFTIPAPLQDGFLSADLIRYEDAPWKAEGKDLDEWVEIYVQHGGSANISLGNTAGGGGLLTRYAGLVTGHVFTRENTGTRRRMLLAKTFAATFQNLSTAGIRFRTAAVAGTPTPIAGYRRTVVQVPFQRDEKT